MDNSAPQTGWLVTLHVLSNDPVAILSLEEEMDKITPCPTGPSYAGGLPVWVVESNGVDNILMPFQSVELLPRQSVPNFTRAVITACDEPAREVAIS